MVRLLQDRQASTVLESVPSAVQVAGRVLQPTPVFDTYWRFASARQAVYEARLAGRSQPWTDLQQGIHLAAADPRPGGRLLGDLRLPQLRPGAVSRVRAGERLYSAACIVPPPQLGEDRKHRNHLRLLEMMMTSGAAERVAEAATMRQAYEVLLSYPAIGPFLAYQFTIDLNYAPQLAFSEMDFVVPGAGARDGIRKCFGPAADGIEADLIRYMADSQRDHFDRL